MKRVLTVTLVAGAVVISPLRALACSCVTESLASHLQRASIVFVGIAQGAGVDASPGIATSFAVEQVLKGTVGPSVTVQTFGACALQFSPRSRYAVFAQRSATGWVTGQCDGTTEDYAAVQARRHPVATYAPQTGLPAVAAGRHAATPFLRRSVASRATPIAVAGTLLLICVAGLVGKHRRA